MQRSQRNGKQPFFLSTTHKKKVSNKINCWVDFLAAFQNDVFRNVRKMTCFTAKLVKLTLFVAQWECNWNTWKTMLWNGNIFSGEHHEWWHAITSGTFTEMPCFRNTVSKMAFSLYSDLKRSFSKHRSKRGTFHSTVLTHAGSQSIRSSMVNNPFFCPQPTRKM